MTDELDTFGLTWERRTGPEASPQVEEKMEALRTRPGAFTRGFLALPTIVTRVSGTSQVGERGLSCVSAPQIKQVLTWSEKARLLQLEYNSKITAVLTDN